MTSRVVAFAALALLGAGLVATADPVKPGGSPAGQLSHMVALPDDIKWGPAPPGLPPGSQAAVLSGDPGKAGTFTVRLKAPDGYVIPPHWHPTDENLTIISGSFGIGLGDKFDKAKVRYLPPGSYVRLGKEERHFAIVKGETVIQVHGTGPFEINYLDPTDDPRKKDK
jgi:ChrR-like protein with cupin domain